VQLACVGALGALVAFGLAAAGPVAPAAMAPRDLLKSVAGITDREWAAVERGEPLARILPSDRREIAVVGAIRIAADRNQLAARYRSIDSLKRSAIVLDAGVFGGVPAASDLSRLVFEDHGLDLRDCTPGDCRVRLGAGEIARFHREVDWNAPDWKTRSATLWREVLAGYAAAYQENGRKALPVFANKAEPLGVASEFDLLLGSYGFLADYSPALHTYLRTLGPEAPPRTEGTLYWTKEDFGVRPLIRISHQIVQTPARGNDPLIVTSNQVYADHYLDAAITATLSLSVAEDEGRSFYMVSINRARTRSLTGMLRTMIRSTVQGRSRDAMRKILVATKTALEAEQRQPGRPFDVARGRPR
jgi:hypothetical protein